MFINIGILSRCNLKCKFCYCRQDKPFDLDSLLSIPDACMQELERSGMKDCRYDIGIVGGEIFMDGLQDSVFDQYNILLNVLKERLQQYTPNSTFHLHCYSNGVYHKIDRVFDFLKKWDSEIVLSYDSIDRFQNDKQRDLMLDNMQLMVNNQIVVRPTVVIFKQCDMSSFLGTPIFNKIYNLTGIDYQECIPNVYNISDQRIADFYIECLNKKFFNIDNIQNLLEGYIHKSPSVSCRRSLTYYEGRAYIGCHYIKDDFEHIKNNILNKFNCFSCDYFQQCPGQCWVQAAQKQTSFCINKTIFKYLDTHPKIVESYGALE